MAALTSTEDLKDYCLRKLGAPVINIAIDNVQAYERIEDTIAYFSERHYDGNDVVIVKKTILDADVQNGYLTLDAGVSAILEVLSTDTTPSEVMDDIQYNFMVDFQRRGSMGGIAEYVLSRQHLSLINRYLGSEKLYSYNSTTRTFDPLWKFTNIGSTNLFTNSDDLEAWDVLAGTPTVTNNNAVDSLGNQIAHTIESTAAEVNTISTTVDSENQYIRGWKSVAIGFRSDNYTGVVSITMKDAAGTVVATVDSEAVAGVWTNTILEGQFDNTHTSDIVCEISWTSTGVGEILELSAPFLFTNNFLVMRGYTDIDSTNVFDHRWVKLYATALLKRQWGTNIKKFDGVQLPGGIVMNGQQIYDEAAEELTLLEEEFSLTYEEPVSFFMG